MININSIYNEIYDSRTISFGAQRAPNGAER